MKKIINADKDDHIIEQLKREVLSDNILSTARSRHGIGRIEVVAASFVNERNLSIPEVEQNQVGTIVFLLRANQDVKNASFGMHLYDRMNELIFAAGARNLGIALRNLKKGQEMMASYKVRFSVSPGEYTLAIGCSAESDEPMKDVNLGVVDDRHEGIGPIIVHADKGKLFSFYGKAQLDVKIEYLD